MQHLLIAVAWSTYATPHLTKKLITAAMSPTPTFVITTDTCLALERTMSTCIVLCRKNKTAVVSSRHIKALNVECKKKDFFCFFDDRHHVVYDTILSKYNSKIKFNSFFLVHKLFSSFMHKYYNYLTEYIYISISFWFFLWITHHNLFFTTNLNFNGSYHVLFISICAPHRTMIIIHMSNNRDKTLFSALSV